GMFERMKMGDEVRKGLGDLLEEKGFVDIETGILRKSRGEGAGEYVVGRGVEEGEFYAVGESPQLFKELVMVCGMDGYYEIAGC
ncbi:amino acid--tRNA ligase-related protein, partial [Bacillus sp. WP8]|uniref:amino acid--tRNA ligase-related protein n=1 Tax=Bacillus sp. WP8 TaxID=756828 RepID=UPI0028CB5B12